MEHAVGDMQNDCWSKAGSLPLQKNQSLVLKSVRVTGWLQGDFAQRSV